jgi:2'-5' RNA ligase
VTNAKINIFFSLRPAPQLTRALTELQSNYGDRVEPQRPGHMHITLAYLADVDVHRLADAAALISAGTWPSTPITLTGDIRHGSWELQKNPDYHYDPETVQTREQIRLGVEHNAGLTTIRSHLLRHLQIPQRQYWPHITLGLARHDMPAASLIPIPLRTPSTAASSLELQQEITTTHFRVLVRAALDSVDPGPVLNAGGADLL